MVNQEKSMLKLLRAGTGASSQSLQELLEQIPCCHSGNVHSSKDATWHSLVLSDGKDFSSEISLNCFLKRVSIKLSSAQSLITRTIKINSGPCTAKKSIRHIWKYTRRDSAPNRNLAARFFHLVSMESYNRRMRGEKSNKFQL